MKNMKKKNTNPLSPEEREALEIKRIKLPNNNQVLGLVSQRLGGSRLRVRCFDNKERICRIPGSKKRFLWVREGDLVLVEPWENSGDKKGDIIFKYTKTQINYLKRKGYMQDYQDFEFDEF